MTDKKGTTAVEVDDVILNTYGQSDPLDLGEAAVYIGEKARTFATKNPKEAAKIAAQGGVPIEAPNRKLTRKQWKEQKQGQRAPPSVDSGGVEAVDVENLQGGNLHHTAKILEYLKAIDARTKSHTEMYGKIIPALTHLEEVMAKEIGVLNREISRQDDSIRAMDKELQMLKAALKEKNETHREDGFYSKGSRDDLFDVWGGSSRPVDKKKAVEVPVRKLTDFTTHPFVTGKALTESEDDEQMEITPAPIPKKKKVTPLPVTKKASESSKAVLF